ncbi:MAG: hypothetical protein QNJ15_07775 [Erythrobacter sp.]|nr:hypothetical protein [Erythrobacter sp.]
MARIATTKDCGNSPKNLAAQELAIALEGGEFASVLLDEKSVWVQSDGRMHKGVSEIEVASRAERTNIAVHRVATHGKAGAVSGVTDGEAFAHILTYTTASAKRILRIESFRKNGFQ